MCDSFGCVTGWEGSGTEEGRWDRCFSFLFFSGVHMGGEERCPSCCQTALAPGEEGWSFDETLETLK